jgi:hypothetical protein
MMHTVIGYFRRLAAAFGSGWTQFWFTPSDSATVSLMRLLVGALVVYLHATLSFDLIALFGAGGLLPAADIAPLESSAWSYLNYLSTPAELWTVHLLGLVVLVLFMVGFWTRLTTILALVVFLSDVNRAPMITGCTESVAAMLLCYLCLSPCGRRFSVDARWSERARKQPGQADATPDEPSTATTIATRLIQIHLALLIGMMALSQLSGEVWWLGSGMWWLIARRESRLIDLTGLYTWPKVIEFWTHAVVLFELCFAVLIWVPLARPLLLACGLVIWTSLALVTGDITFALALLIASLSFVSPDVIGNCCRPARSSSIHPAA